MPAAKSELARMRRERGLLQSQVAKLLDVDPSRISHYESGTSVPTLSGFRLMREAYGVTADALLAAFDAAVRARTRELARRGRNGRSGAAA